MNLTVLYELKERLEAAATAGTGLLGEDFRLKRTVEQMAPLGKASPVFARICQMAQQLTADCDDREGLLLDTLALLNAVLITQGTVGVDGEMEELLASKGQACVNASYSSLSPVLEALRGSGGGRYSLVEKAMEDSPELFKDYRVKYAMAQDLDDSYVDMAEMLTSWLEEERDPSLVPILKREFRPEGGREMARRLRVIVKTAGAGENEFYRASFEHASKEVKAELLRALSYDPSNGEFLAGLVKTERGNAKKLVYYALARMNDENAWELVMDALEKDPEEYGDDLAYVDAEWAADAAAACLNRIYDRILSLGEDERPTEDDERETGALFRAAMGKNSPAMREFIRRGAADAECMEEVFRISHDEKPEQAKGKSNGRKTLFRVRQTSHVRDYKTLKEIIAELLTETILFGRMGKDGLEELARELAQTYGGAYHKAVMAWDLLDMEPEAFFLKYKAVLEPEGLIGGIASRLPGKSRIAGTDLLDLFGRMIYKEDTGEYILIHFPVRADDDFIYEPRYTVLKAPIWEEWYPILADYGKKHPDNFCLSEPQYTVHQNMWGFGSPFSELMDRLLVTGNQSVCETVGKALYHWMQVQGGNYNDVLLLNRCGWKNFKGVLKGMAKRYGNAFRFSSVFLYKLIPILPMSGEEMGRELAEIVAGPLRGKDGAGEIKQWSDQLRGGAKPSELTR